MTGSQDPLEFDAANRAVIAMADKARRLEARLADARAAAPTAEGLRLAELARARDSVAAAIYRCLQSAHILAFNVDEGVRRRTLDFAMEDLARLAERLEGAPATAALTGFARRQLALFEEHCQQTAFVTMLAVQERLRAEAEKRAMMEARRGRSDELRLEAWTVLDPVRRLAATNADICKGHIGRKSTYYSNIIGGEGCRRACNCACRCARRALTRVTFMCVLSLRRPRGDAGVLRVRGEAPGQQLGRAHAAGRVDACAHDRQQQRQLPQPRRLPW